MAKRLGIYVHIPFCASKCAYCDFNSFAGSERLMPKYHNALLKHFRESRQVLQEYYADTVYFGGGTPSYYGARRLADLFNALKREALIFRNAEVTLEANPDSVHLRDLTLLWAEGFNRISLGAQTANEDLLKLIGRRHTWKQTVLAVKTAREAGFSNISLDLIYGLPTQTEADWAETLDRAIGLGPQHISCYGLKLEPGTPMYASYNRSALLPDDDAQADMYLYAVETLERAGYAQYEISNFAKPGFPSRHNLKYWLLRDYIGFGAGAASCAGGVRYKYVPGLRQYISGVQNDHTILEEQERIGLLDQSAEYIMLGLRTVRGISSKEYFRRYRSDFSPLEEELEEYRVKGWAVREDERWHFTPAGFLLSNLLIGGLLDLRGEQRRRDETPWMEQTEESFYLHGELPEGDEVFFHPQEA